MSRTPTLDRLAYGSERFANLEAAAKDFLDTAQDEGLIVSRKMQEKATALRVLLNQ